MTPFIIVHFLLFTVSGTDSTRYWSDFPANVYLFNNDPDPDPYLVDTKQLVSRIRIRVSVLRIRIQFPIRILTIYQIQRK
jgi:hypothetical protein